MVKNYCKNRSKLACFNTLCTDIKFVNVENFEKLIYDQSDDQNSPQSIHILYNINFTTKYKRQLLYFSASIEFKDKFSIYNVNTFSRTNQYWKQNLILLNQSMNKLRKSHILNSIKLSHFDDDAQIRENVVDIVIGYLYYDERRYSTKSRQSNADLSDEIFVIKDNGKIDVNNCMMIQTLFGITVDDDYLIYEYFTLFWQFLISKDIQQYRQDNILSYTSYQPMSTTKIVTATEDPKDTPSTVEIKKPDKSPSPKEESLKLDEPESESSVAGHVLITPAGKAENPLMHEESDKDKFEEEIKTEIEMDGATKQFYSFLNDNKLDNYFQKFQDKDVANICYLPDLIIDDDKFLEIEIGLKHIHRKVFIRKAKDIIDEMNIFKQKVGEYLFDELSKKYGIITTNILCKEVEDINDLRYKFNLKDERQCNLLWTIIQEQLHPLQNQYSIDTGEGTPNVNPLLRNTSEDFPYT